MKVASLQFFFVIGVLCSLAAQVITDDMIVITSRIQNFDRKLLVESREETTTAASSFVCPGSGSYPVPGQECTGVYYSCATGSPVLTACNGANSVFDPTTGSCVSASIAPCKKTTLISSSTISTTPSTTATESKTTTTLQSTTETTEKITPSTPIVSPTESTTKPTSGNTTGTAPQTSTTTTASTTIVSPTESTTNPTIPESTTETAPQTSLSTTTSTIPSSTVTSGTTAAPFSCQPDTNGSFPNPNDCKTFYMCSNGNLYLYDCPSGLVFNPMGYCDYPGNVPRCNSG